MMKQFVLCLMLCLFCALACAEGSWSQINVQLDRPDNWKRIVADPSAFALGGDTAYEGDPSLSIRSWGTYPSMDGSTVCVPMAMEFAREWLDLGESDLTGFVSFSTTPVAYERLTKNAPNPMVAIQSRNVMMDDTKPIDLVLGTAPNQDERKALQGAGKKTVMVPVCYDAFIFMVNKANPVESLTTEQIRDIYSGTELYEYEVPGVEQMIESPTEIMEYKEYLYDYTFKPYISDWEEVGRESGEIVACQRPHGSGSQTAMEELVMGDRPLLTVNGNYIYGGMGEIVSRVGSFTEGYDAIGYSYLYYVNALYRDDNIKVIAVNGIEPTTENLRNGTYPYTVCYYAVYEEGNETARRFVDWMTSDEGQACIAQAGYVSLR